MNKKYSEFALVGCACKVHRIHQINRSQIFRAPLLLQFNFSSFYLAIIHFGFLLRHCCHGAAAARLA